MWAYLTHSSLGYEVPRLLDRTLAAHSSRRYHTLSSHSYTCDIFAQVIANCRPAFVIPTLERFTSLEAPRLGARR